jgi:hypothetical protein
MQGPRLTWPRHVSGGDLANAWLYAPSNGVIQDRLPEPGEHGFAAGAGLHHGA